MKIHHLRNATFVIETQNRFILIDPMLSGVGELPTFTYFKHKAQKNPLVPLPNNATELLSKITHCLITHSQKLGIELLTHSDHLDNQGKTFLKKNNIPIVTLQNDASYLKKHGLNVLTGLYYNKSVPFLDGTITAIKAKHGHSWMHNFMANGAGYVVELPNEPSIYISGDTVLTDDVRNALQEFQPDISVVASGGASLDMGGEILMSTQEITSFITLSPKAVIANHLEALNHCPITRDALRKELEKKGLSQKTYIPKDGEVLEITI